MAARPLALFIARCFVKSVASGFTYEYTVRLIQIIYCIKYNYFNIFQKTSNHPNEIKTYS